MLEVIRRARNCSVKQKLHRIRERNLRGNEYGLRWTEFKDRVLVERVEFFSSKESRTRFQAGLALEENFREVIALLEPKEA